MDRPSTTVRGCQTQRSKVWMDQCIRTSLLSIPHPIHAHRQYSKDTYMACPSQSWDVKADSTILSHISYRHNITDKLFTPSSQKRMWVRRAVFLYESQCFLMTPADHDLESEGWGMTLCCRPDPDQKHIPLWEPSCLFPYPCSLKANPNPNSPLRTNLLVGYGQLLTPHISAICSH